MKRIISNYINKIKTFSTKDFSISVKFLTITVLSMLVLSSIVYNYSSSLRLNSLIDFKKQTVMQDIRDYDSEAQKEIEELTEKKEKLSSELSSKTTIQTAMDKYNSDKEEYTNKITALTSENTELDTSIQSKQTQLSEKKAAKEAEERRIAEEKAAEEARIIQEMQNAQEETVWIGETGTKYHHQDCRTLKGNKYEITLSEARSQGRDACKVCH